MMEKDMINYDYLYNKNYYKNFIEKNNKSEAKLSYAILQNAYVLPYRDSLGGLLDENHNYIDTSAVHNFCEWCGGAYEFSENECKFYDETVIWLGSWFGVWGHCLTDNLKHLWFLKTEIYKEQWSDCKLVYIPYAGFQLEGNIKKLLIIMGFDVSQFIPVNEPAQFRQVIYPDSCFYNDEYGNRYFTEEYQDLINAVREYARENYKETGIEKVYFTYSKFASSKNFGEYRLEKFFEKQGYKVIAPENYTLEEQLNILQGCKFFASTIGSAAHNIIFCNEGVSVILIPRADYLTGYQIALNNVWKMDVVFVDATLSVATDRTAMWHGPFYYFISDKLLEFFSQDITKDRHYWRYNAKGFLSYCLYGMVKNNLDGNSCILYYSEELQKFLFGMISSSVLFRFIRKMKLMQIIMKIKKVLRINN